MKTVVLKTLAFLGVLGAEAWFLWNPDGWNFEWEPLLAFGGALAALLGFEGYEASRSRTPPQAINSNDVRLFRKLLASLPSFPVIEFFKNHDFGGSFSREQIDPLYSFLQEWDNPEHEFVDAELEQKRKDFFAAAQLLGRTVAKNSAPNRTGLLSVLPDEFRARERPDWVQRDAKEINDAANRFVELHAALVREGRKRLDLEQEA